MYYSDHALCKVRQPTSLLLSSHLVQVPSGKTPYITNIRTSLKQSATPLSLSLALLEPLILLALGCTYITVLLFFFHEAPKNCCSLVSRLLPAGAKK